MEQEIVNRSKGLSILEADVKDSIKRRRALFKEEKNLLRSLDSLRGVAKKKTKTRLSEIEIELHRINENLSVIDKHMTRQIAKGLGSGRPLEAR